MEAPQPFFDNPITNRLVDKGELARILKISERTLKRLNAEGVPRIVIRGQYRYCVAEVVGWLRNRSNPWQEATKRGGGRKASNAKRASPRAP
jgi:phage terminase Nu1 subunit (DNA packaging protein)